MPALSNIIRLVLIALLVVTPWFFGGVLATTQWGLMLAVAVLLALDVASRFSGEDRPSMVPTAWLPALAGILLGIVQLIPWSPELAAYVAPQTLAWQIEMTNDWPDQELGAASVNQQVRRTVYAVATREYLALLTLAMAVFVLAALHLVDRQSLNWLLWSVGVCGAALSFFGLVQRLSWNGKFYWMFESVNGGLRSFGPFVNRNNGGGFLNLCLAAALGLLVWLHTQSDVDDNRLRASRRRHRDARSSEDGHLSPVLAKSGKGEETPSLLVTEGTATVSTDEEAAAENTPCFGEVGELREVRDPQLRPTGADTGDAVPFDDASDGPVHTQATNCCFNMRQSISAYFADLNAARLAALAISALTAGGVLCTASRGSILALLVAALVTASALAVQRGQRGFAAGMLMLLLASGGLMSWAGQTDFVTRRFERLLAEPQHQSGRWAHWKEAINVVPEFPVWGTGLGTHRLVYERYQQRFLPDHIYTHAENQYVQSLIEGGIVALGLLLLAILLILVAIIRLYRTGGPVNLALAVTGSFALASQVVGGVFDFGLYLPANAVLMAAICGIVAGRAALLTVWPADALDSIGRGNGRHRSLSRFRDVHSAEPRESIIHHKSYTVSGAARSRRERQSRQIRSSTKEPGSSRWLSLWIPSTLTTFISGFLLLGCLFGSLEMHKARQVEAAVRQAPLDRLAQETDPQVIAMAADSLAAVLLQRWDDAAGHRHLARLQMMQYRAETYQRLLGESSASNEVQPKSNDEAAIAVGSTSERNEELWGRASIVQLHQAIRTLERKHRTQAVNRLRNGPLIQDTLLPAIGHLRLARRFAPTIPEVYYELAALAALDPKLNTDHEEVYLNRLCALSPGNATFWFLAGQLDLNSGRKGRACSAWSRSLQLSSMHLHEIVTAAQGKLTIGELLSTVLPKQADVLLDVARNFFAAPGRERIQQLFLERAEDSLDKTRLPPADLAYTAAVILRMRGRGVEAVSHYREAVMLHRSKLAWQYELATLLLELKQYDAALELSKSLMNARRDIRTYERLHKQILGQQLRNQRSMN